MRKIFIIFLMFGLVLTVSACRRETFEIAMITDAGDIDDESFNQGTWEGIVEYAEANNISHRYYRPAEVSDTAYLDAINLAVNGGAKIVITPGFLFEEAIYVAQERHPDVKFVLIDGQPHDGDWPDPDFHVGDNTVSIFFAEEESGFLAGYAAVMDGFEDLGFMGGMAVPAVVRFGVGYIAGAYYAANELEKEINFPNNRYTYLGNFDPSPDHKDMAESWYFDGTDIIFAAAGGAGSSIMAAAEDSDAWMIGVDVDQSANSPTVLTSAMKALGVAVQDMLEDFYNDAFRGGEVINLTASEDGVGLPTDDDAWRFDTFTVAQYNSIYDQIADGTIDVPANYTDLVAFFDTHDLAELQIESGTVQPE